ncbi:MAG TPA: GNAT family N-acetyltransferase [Clostridiales bacterium]|nr:GNAT family N-acetyltransferase [Clostridiales bacterium]
MLIDSGQFLGNIENIQHLFRRSFNREIERRYIVWRYVDNPLKHTLVSVNYDNGNVTANYSACPCYLSYKSITMKSALSMTTMTDPDYRGKGIFPLLARELYDFICQNGYKMVWGFPNHFSHAKFITSLNWSNIYEIPTMVLNLSSYTFKGTIQYETDNTFDMSYDDSIIRDDLIHVLKSQIYLKWRYAQNPVNKYYNIVILEHEKVSSYLVFKYYGQCLDIVDFQVVNYDEAEYLLQAVIGIANDHKLSYINCWAPVHHFIHPLCEKYGFRSSTPITYFGGRILDEQLDQKDYLNYSNWYIQMGDSDVY